MPSQRTLILDGDPRPALSTCGQCAPALWIRHRAASVLRKWISIRHSHHSLTCTHSRQVLFVFLTALVAFQTETTEFSALDEDSATTRIMRLEAIRDDSLRTHQVHALSRRCVADCAVHRTMYVILRTSSSCRQRTRTRSPSPRLSSAGSMHRIAGVCLGVDGAKRW